MDVDQVTHARTDALDVLVERFAALLELEGLHGALAFLNGRTRLRFTGVYRFDPPMLRGVCLFDRENPAVKLGGDLPMNGTPCSLVREWATPFATDDAPRDPRLVDHPARELVVSYAGVPLMADAANCFGTLCHFDPRPRVAPLREMPLLERVAPVVMRFFAPAGQPT